jgi:hypothetical protein
VVITLFEPLREDWECSPRPLEQRRTSGGIGPRFPKPVQKIGVCCTSVCRKLMFSARLPCVSMRSAVPGGCPHDWRGSVDGAPHCLRAGLVQQLSPRTSAILYVGVAFPKPRTVVGDVPPVPFRLRSPSTRRGPYPIGGLKRGSPRKRIWRRALPFGAACDRTLKAFKRMSSV